MFDEFVVTHLDTAIGTGYVRHVTAKGGYLIPGPISFELGRPADVTYDSEYGFGYSLPSVETCARVPEIDMILVGAVACTNTTWGIALDAAGDPFLRNWGYADQRDELERANHVDEIDDQDQPDDTDDFADFADDDEIDPVSLAEILHGRAHEMYN